MAKHALHDVAQVEIGSVDVAKFDDAYFKPTEKKDKKKGEAEFFQVGTACAGGSCCRCCRCGTGRRSAGAGTCNSGRAACSVCSAIICDGRVAALAVDRQRQSVSPSAYSPAMWPPLQRLIAVEIRPQCSCSWCKACLPARGVARGRAALA